MRYYYYILILLLSILFFSCEKEIDLDLNPVEPRLVIDASIGAMRPCLVRLSMTQDYWDQDLPTPINKARVTIEDQKGNSEILYELDNEGVYVSRVLGVPGTTYTLTVEVDEEVYIATDMLPHPVPIDAIRTYKVDSGGDQYYFPCITFEDPKGEDNYYYYSLRINERMMQGTRYDDDKYSDGRIKEPILFFDDAENHDKELEVGDFVQVEMQSIGKGAHTFYKTISSPGGSANSNPAGNFSGDVLGMFKTYSPSYIEMIIAEEDLAK